MEIITTDILKNLLLGIILLIHILLFWQASGIRVAVFALEMLAYGAAIAALIFLQTDFASTGPLWFRTSLSVSVAAIPTTVMTLLWLFIVDKRAAKSNSNR